jgi:DNA-binding transcriptional LysR family regulator
VLGMPAALRHLVTLPALQAMRSKSPGTAVRVHEGFNVFLRDMLNHGLLDIAVIAVDEVSESSIAPEMVVREPLVLVRCAALWIARSANGTSLPKFRSSPRTQAFVWNSSDMGWSDRR